MAIEVRRHGWQSPLRPIQIVGMAVFSFLFVAFYLFLGLLLGSTITEIISFAMFTSSALSSVILFIRCTATDPTDNTHFKNKKKTGISKGLQILNYGHVFAQIVARYFRRLERKFLRSVIRRKYLDPVNTSAFIESLLPFSLVTKDDTVLLDLNEEDVTVPSVIMNKHGRTCNRCVEGFNHHCRWLNNCIGKRNYTTFMLLRVSVVLMLIIEGGTSVSVFIRWFVDKKGMELAFSRELHVEFPRGLLAATSLTVWQH